MRNNTNLKFASDYKKDQMFVSVVSALRSYSDLHDIGDKTHSLERIIDSAVSIYKENKLEDLSMNVIRQVRSILCLNNKAKEDCTSGFFATRQDGIYVITAGIGEYTKFNKLYMVDMLSHEVQDFLKLATTSGCAQYGDYEYCEPFTDDGNACHLIYLKSCQPINRWDKNLIDLFSTSIANELSGLHSDNESQTEVEEILFALGEVVEARAKVIGNHVERVSCYAQFIACKLGMSNHRVDLIKAAAPIHDLGKLLIDDDILNKPGKLTAEEFEVVKEHSRYGWQMLNDTKGDLFRVASEIVLSHHEKYDGSGYPQGLVGDAIPMSARIVAFADVVDALSSDSVYKKAWDFDKMLALIKEESGGHFDPKIVDGFLNHLDEFIALKSKLTKIK